MNARLPALVLAFLLALTCGGGALAQQTDATAADGNTADSKTFVINLRDADISVLAEQVSKITGRTLVMDPNLSGAVSVVSAEKLDKDGVWALFQSILKVRGFVAVQSGTVWQVVPEDQARTAAGGGADQVAGSADFVTRLLRLQRLPSAEAVRVLRPLVAASGYIEALADPNAIVITDTLANVDRITAIAQAFDGQADLQAEVIRFRYADAASVGNAIVEVLGQAGTGARLSVDPASNLLLVRGTTKDIEEIRSLARSMDIAPAEAPQLAVGTTVFRLQYGDAEVITEIVRSTLGGATSAPLDNPVAQATGAAAPLPADGTDAAAQGGRFVPLDKAQPASAVSVQASTETNSIIVRGTAAQVREVGVLIGQLDVRRPQVMIEAAIVEVSGDVAERLGIQLGFGAAAPPNGLAATSFGNGGVSLQGVLAALGATGSAALSTGLTIGAGTNDFGVLIQALAQSTRARLLSTPSVTTLDNETATIVVGQNVPFRTGSFATDGNTLTPFTTIERKDVGITMKVLPRITAGGIVQLVIEQEVSNLVNANVEGAADLITNRRVINTTVLADDGGTVVLGGLITDDQTASEQKVPLLGDVPVIGNLFKSRNKQATSRTLFVFLRPTILRDRRDVDKAAEQRYGRLRGAEAAAPPKSLLTEKKVRKLPLEIEGIY